MTGHLSDTDLRRLRRSGIAPMSNAQGLAFFDRALARPGGPSLLVPAKLDTHALRGPGAQVPALLRGLVPAAAPAPAPRRPAARRRGRRSPAGHRRAPRRSRRVSPGTGAAHPGQDRGRRRPRPRRSRRGRPRPYLPGHRLRLPHRGGAAQPPQRGDRAAAGRRRGLRPAHGPRDRRAHRRRAGRRHRRRPPGGETALAGLETLEAAVAALADDDIRRETLHRRLAVLVTALGGPDAGGPAGGAGPDPLVTAPRDLAGVDDEELFAFIEEQL